jgi:HAMP domain-containing protein
VWEAQTLGLAFGDWDYEAILRDMPERVRKTWMARYLIEPWDAANRVALGKMQHKPPTWIRAMIAKNGKRQKKARPERQFMTRDEIQQLRREAGY